MSYEKDGLREVTGLKRALLVGINHYEILKSLSACVADTLAVEELVKRHENGSRNYECIVLTATDVSSAISRSKLRKAIVKLFDFDGSVLFYFSGHGFLSSTGGYLCTSDGEEDDWGIPMQEVMDLANKSAASEILMLLDCCHSGDAGNLSFGAKSCNESSLALLRKDLTVLAASLDRELAFEKAGHGLFTQALIDALDGGASDHFGHITAASIYAYVERRFGAWGQRPVYKSHSTAMYVVRRCAPPIEHDELSKLPVHFENPDFKFQLDPDFEPEDEHGNKTEPLVNSKIELSQLFKRYRDAGILKSTEGEQFYWTARHSKTVELTKRGKECWWLVKNERVP